MDKRPLGKERVEDEASRVQEKEDFDRLCYL